MKKQIRNEYIKYNDFMNEKYKGWEDKDIIYPAGITDSEFRKFAIDLLLGEDWFVSDPLSQKQVNEEALESIIEKYKLKKRK